ncbi:MAG: hypothetical protein NVSMB64_18530 [Candidatus Velthaea sp.]
MSPLALIKEGIASASTRIRRPERVDAPRVDRPDEVRAADRAPVLRARLQKRRVRLFLILAGPGLLVMIGENDGPSMLAYATTGATYGIGFFVPFVIITFAMAFVVQELTVRLGMASGCGHAKLIFDRFGRGWGTFAIGDLVLSNVLTLVTEFIAICAGAQYFGIPGPVAAGFALLVAVTAFAAGRYRTWERIAIGLAVGNLAFVPAAFFAHPDPHSLIASLGHWGQLPHGDQRITFLTLVMATIGATVTPWMVFFQQSTVVDKGLTRADLPQARLDTALGALVAAGIAIATIVAASPLFLHHINISALQNGADFASALRPYLGNVGASLFALGLIEAGLVAIMTISTSSAYALGDLSQEGASLNLRFTPRRLFYGTGILSAVIAAAVVLIPGAPLLAITIGVNVTATLLMPPALIFLLLLINDKSVAGDLVNTWYTNIAAGTVAFAICAIGLLYVVVSFFPRLLQSRREWRINRAVPSPLLRPTLRTPRYSNTAVLYPMYACHVALRSHRAARIRSNPC